MTEDRFRQIIREEISRALAGIAPAPPASTPEAAKALQLARMNPEESKAYLKSLTQRRAA
jgi:hypothetical protein